MRKDSSPAPRKQETPVAIRWMEVKADEWKRHGNVSKGLEYNLFRRGDLHISQYRRDDQHITLSQKSVLGINCCALQAGSVCCDNSSPRHDFIPFLWRTIYSWDFSRWSRFTLESVQRWHARLLYPSITVRTSIIGWGKIWKRDYVLFKFKNFFFFCRHKWSKRDGSDWEGEDQIKK